MLDLLFHNPSSMILLDSEHPKINLLLRKILESKREKREKSTYLMD
jgi:hypothetical protein